MATISVENQRLIKQVLEWKSTPERKKGRPEKFRCKEYGSEWMQRILLKPNATSNKMEIRYGQRRKTF